MSVLPYSRMQLFVGTSGFGYDEWKGTFYPSGVAADDRLGFYASRLSTVELNNTFYRTWAQRIGQTWDETYVFFSHERSGPRLAARMIAIARDLGLEAPGA